MNEYDCAPQLSSVPRQRWKETLRQRLTPGVELPAGRSAKSAPPRNGDTDSNVLLGLGALVVILDREGRIARFNRACEQLTGYAWQEVEGECVWDLMLVSEQVEPVKGQRSLRILLVDDELIVRQTLGDYLRESGHQVDEACDGPAAIRSIGACDHAWL